LIAVEEVEVEGSAAKMGAAHSKAATSKNFMIPNGSSVESETLEPSWKKQLQMGRDRWWIPPASEVLLFV
jgi:hypothetical protein